MHTTYYFNRTVVLVLIFMPLMLLANGIQNKQGNISRSKSPFTPGDGLFISTFPDTTSFLNNIFPIDDKGCVEFPIVGLVNVSQKSENELIEYIKDNFQQYIRSKNIYVKPMARVTVMGGVANPGLYYFDYNTSLWNVIQKAGGPLAEDGLKKMRWERNGDELEDNLMPFIENGISLKNLGFQSGDQIWTPTPIPPARFDILPYVTFVSSIVFFYFTYQMQLYTYTVLRR